MAKKCYIAGKITGDKDYKAKFAAAEEQVRDSGYIPINPALLPEGMEARDYMRICTAMMLTADLIVLLPDWENSPGAKIEADLAEYAGIPIWQLTKEMLL